MSERVVRETKGGRGAAAAAAGELQAQLSVFVVWLRLGLDCLSGCDNPSIPSIAGDVSRVVEAVVFVFVVVAVSSSPSSSSSSSSSSLGWQRR